MFYFHVWSKLMMPAEGPPPMSFFYYSVIFGIITGILIACVYAIVRGVPGGGIKRGLVYGFLMFLVTGVPSSLSLYLLVNLPSALIVYWGFENLVTYLLGGAVFGRLIK